MDIAGDRPPRYGRRKALREHRDQEVSPTGNRDWEVSPTRKALRYETPSFYFWFLFREKMEIRQHTMNAAMETFFPLGAKILRHPIAKLP